MMIAAQNETADMFNNAARLPESPSRGPVFSVRQIDGENYIALRRAGLSPVKARLLASRGVTPEQLDLSLKKILPVSTLTDCLKAGKMLADAIEKGKRICVVADYDSDGATSAAIMVTGLRKLGADTDYVVPDRHKHGYGLSPAVMDEVIRKYGETGKGLPEIIVTVDNGIVATEGIRRAKEMGMEVIVTDHHLAGDELPPADVIVNPNRRDCPFASKAMAGCGVAWYVICAAAKFRASYPAHPDADPSFSPKELLDYVAVGTVADVVPLDYNNRILIKQGLDRIRNGLAHPGVYALCDVSATLHERITTTDIAFRIAPRINAAGRLDDMSVGIDCLMAQTYEEAAQGAEKLNELNLKRRGKEAQVADEAAGQILDTLPGVEEDGMGEQRTVVVAGEGWDEGVVGIVASRLKERFNRPSIVMSVSSSDPEVLKGSARSIQGFHFRDALVETDRRLPGALIKYGGHAMAAGLTLRRDALEDFKKTFEEVAKEQLTMDDLQLKIVVDGSLNGRDIDCDLISELEDGLWGQAFPAPSFRNIIRVLEQRQIGADKTHKKLKVSVDGQVFEAVKWRCVEDLPEWVQAEYTLSNNTYMGRTSPQLMLAALKETDGRGYGSALEDGGEGRLSHALQEAEKIFQNGAACEELAGRAAGQNGGEALFSLQELSML